MHPDHSPRRQFIDLVHRIREEEGLPIRAINNESAAELTLSLNKEGHWFDIVHHEGPNAQQGELVFIRALVCSLPTSGEGLEALLEQALMTSHVSMRSLSGAFAVDLEARELHFVSALPVDGLEARELLGAMGQLSVSISTWHQNAAQYH